LLRLRFIQYYKADKIAVDEMGRTVSTPTVDDEKLRKDNLLEI
jgi:hypothetical protein